MPEGRYDVHVTFSDGLVHKDLWFDNQRFSGDVTGAAELGVQFAEPTVRVTRDGRDVRGEARVAYINPATHVEIGALKSGATARLEAGTYDIAATLIGAEGWLRAVTLEGKKNLTIEATPLKTEQLHEGGPPPAACVIEVYGANFDFDKAVLRPDSEPVLKQILALFAGTPDFSAEVGGHTDDTGLPEYNLKLSDARAAAVKTWLVAHGVAAARVASRGYGDTRPLAPNTTEQNRLKNRRVELRTANCR